MKFIQQIFTFYSSTFNTSNNKEYYINQGNYGDDLAIWLADKMEKYGAIIQRNNEFPGQEDFGWYVNFILNNQKYRLIIGSRPDERNNIEWVGWIEKKSGVLSSLFGGRKRVDNEPIEFIHKIISSSNEIMDIKWHIRKDFDKEKEDISSKEPFINN